MAAIGCRDSTSYRGDRRGNSESRIAILSNERAESDVTVYPHVNNQQTYLDVSTLTYAKVKREARKRARSAYWKANVRSVKRVNNLVPRWIEGLPCSEISLSSSTGSSRTKTLWMH